MNEKKFTRNYFVVKEHLLLLETFHKRLSDFNDELYKSHRSGTQLALRYRIEKFFDNKGIKDLEKFIETFSKN